VEIVDANGAKIVMQTNSVGNFYSTNAVATPYTAKVVRGGAELSMGAAQTETNCATCHTRDGANGAPGRIVAP
jgi:mono/diheme cytochrome c family protein